MGEANSKEIKKIDENTLRRLKETHALICKLSETKKGTRFNREGFKKYIQSNLSDHVKYDENFANHLFRCFFIQFDDEAGGTYVLKSSSSSSSEVSLRRFISAYYYTEHASKSKTSSSKKSSSVKVKWCAILFHILDMDFDGKILKTNICDFVNTLILIDDINVLFSDDSSNDNNLIIVDDLNLMFNDMVDDFFRLSTSSLNFEFMNEAEFISITERGASTFPRKLNSIFLRLVNYVMFNDAPREAVQVIQQQQQPNVLPPLPQPTIPPKIKVKGPDAHGQHHKKHHYSANRDPDEELEKEKVEERIEPKRDYKEDDDISNDYDDIDDFFKKPHKHKTTSYDDIYTTDDTITDPASKEPKKSKKGKKKAVKKPTKPLPPTPPQQQKLSTKSLPGKFSGASPQSARSKTMVNVPPRDTSYYLSSGTIMSPIMTSNSKSNSNGDLGIAPPTTTTASNTTSAKNSATDDMSADIGSEVGTDTHGVVGGISSTGASLEEGGEDGEGGGAVDYFGGGWRGRNASGRRMIPANGGGPQMMSKSCNLSKVQFSSTSSSSSDFNFLGDEDPYTHGRNRRNMPPKASTLRLRSSNTSAALAAKKDPLAASLSALPKYPPMMSLFSPTTLRQKPLPQPPQQQPSQQVSSPQQQQQQQQQQNFTDADNGSPVMSSMASDTIDVAKFTTPPYQPPGRKAEDLFVLCMRSMENGEYLRGAALAQHGLAALPDNAEPRCRVSLTSYHVALRILNTLQCAKRDSTAVSAPRLAMLAGWLMALPMHKEHKEACLLIASLYNEVAARATQTFVPECAPLAERFAPKGVPGYVVRCRNCGARCNAAFPRCATCGTEVLYCCLTLSPIEGKGKQYFKCAFCKATFGDLYSENKFECPVCKRISLTPN